MLAILVAMLGGFRMLGHSILLIYLGLSTMKSSKTKIVLLCAILSSLFLSQALMAEESYERFTVRTWTYRDGTKGTGKLITVTGPTVTLKLEGQGTVRVPLEKLSVKDLNWLYEYYKRKKQLSFLPPEYRKPQTAVPESKPQPETPKPADTAPDRKQPEKSMPVKPEAEESYKPFTVREWTLKDGKQHQAKFLSLSLNKALLQKEPVGLLQIPLDQLSQKDLDWVIEYHRRNKMQGLLPKEYQSEKAGNLSGGVPSVKSPSATIKMKHPIKPGENPLKVAQEKAEARMEKQREEMREKVKALAKDADPNVIKADTEIDPTLVAALRDFRVWTDKKGQKSEARFSSINGREVMFVTRNTGFARVHIGTLIEEDLQLLRDALKMHGRMDEIPLVYREDLDPNLSPTKLKQIIRVNNHRKWTDLSGNSVGASYVKMEDGNVTLIITKTGATQEFPYLNFSAEDQEYVQERLRKEIPGNFFPAEAAGVDLSITPQERENEFRIWTDRSKRQIKGKFVRLAYGKSVAVINTGEKEELFITGFFSDQDLSLIKPREKKKTEQLAMNGGGNPGIPGGMNRGFPGRIPGAMTGNSPFSNQNPNRMNENLHFKQRTFSCPLCKKTHKSDSHFFTQCPHCGLKDTDSIYTCENCSRSFKTDSFQGVTAPCPHCNKKTENNQVAANNFSRPRISTTRKNTYTCESCNREFTAEGHGNTAPCPYCNSGFLPYANFWTAIIKLVVVVILLAGGGSYYRYSR
ncbi:DNA-directed RNA polymerase subunit P [Gimesia fumaroli]|uniref:DNA-directed RNA polymerase subunit P n=2 Tax=Gimesia fumaroli TaxID=2527976 RepID=A0A518I598_9PLAN|nr:DNA-directed RNA polymerase subunit P [Gimesia fumaroli]